MTTFKQFIAEGPAKELPRPVFLQILEDIDQAIKKTGAKIKGRQRLSGGRLYLYLYLDYHENDLLSEKMYMKVVENKLAVINGYRATNPTHIMTNQLKHGMKQIMMVFNIVKK